MGGRGGGGGGGIKYKQVRKRVKMRTNWNNWYTSDVL